MGKIKSFWRAVMMIKLKYLMLKYQSPCLNIFSTEQALPKDWLLSLHSTPFLDTERRPPVQKLQVMCSPVLTPAAGNEGKPGAHIFHFIETECLSGGA